MRNRLTLLGATALSITTLALSGCAGGTNPSTGATTEGNAAGVEEAKQQIAKYTEAVEGFVPNTPLESPESLAGKKAMYIPAVSAVPYFATSYKGTQQAFDKLGMSTQLCDAQANPSNLSSCFNQVLNQNFSAVVVDSIDPSLALEAYTAVAKAGIPVVLMNVGVPADSPSNVVAFSGPNVLGQQLASDAIIADSNGAANVVGVKVIDHPGTIAWWENGAAEEYKKLCPGCKLTTVETKTTDLQNLPSKVSAALLQNPDAKYLQAELSPETIPTIKGATDAGRSDQSVVTAAATLSDLQQLKDGSGLKWAVGWDNVRMQWLATDLVARLLLKMETDAASYTVEPRVFTADNAKDLDVSQAGWEDSNWFGGSNYRSALTTLWTKQ
jgi:ribose transport system substrate-binding protein